MVRRHVSKDIADLRSCGDLLDNAVMRPWDRYKKQGGLSIIEAFCGIYDMSGSSDSEVWNRVSLSGLDICLVKVPTLVRLQSNASIPLMSSKAQRNSRKPANKPTSRGTSQESWYCLIIDHRGISQAMSPKCCKQD